MVGLGVGVGIKTLSFWVATGPQAKTTNTKACETQAFRPTSDLDAKSKFLQREFKEASGIGSRLV